MLQTIEKASDVLALFDRDHTEWGVREVAEALGLAKSSAHDLLTSLAQVGFLGSRLYAHCSALGKVLLAYRPEADVKRIVKTEGLPRFTPHTITDAHTTPRFR
jgi:DNA-binding IclR family transcriptional regulator